MNYHIMVKTGSFLDFEVWQKAHQLVLGIYKISQNFPADERFGLTPQIRRAAVSVAANLVEGYKRKGRLDKIRCYNISQASLEEVKYFLILLKDLNYLENNLPFMTQADEISKMLDAYIKKIQN